MRTNANLDFNTSMHGVHRQVEPERTEKSPMRLLIADDDSAALAPLQVLLKEWGYEVTAVSDGNAAWKLLRDRDAPQLALLDWMMPGCDGTEVCRRVREESAARFVYLILLTSKHEVGDVVQGIESGADDYVMKPFDAHELKVRLRAGRRIVDFHQQLLAQAARDALTGVWNRKVILEILEGQLATARRGDSTVAVILADIDHFRCVNDTCGHPAGDVALREIANRLGAVLRPSDSLGRYGGEELLAVLPNCDLPEAIAVAERMRRAVSDTAVNMNGNRAQLTLSLGLTVSDERGFSADDFIKTADEALYRAKRRGRNRVEVSPHPEDVYRLDLNRWDFDRIL